MGITTNKSIVVIIIIHYILCSQTMLGDLGRCAVVGRGVDMLKEFDCKVRHLWFGFLWDEDATFVLLGSLMWWWIWSVFLGRRRCFFSKWSLR